MTDTATATATETDEIADLGEAIDMIVADHINEVGEPVHYPTIVAEARDSLTADDIDDLVQSGTMDEWTGRAYRMVLAATADEIAADLAGYTS